MSQTRPMGAGRWLLTMAWPTLGTKAEVLGEERLRRPGHHLGPLDEFEGAREQMLARTPRLRPNGRIEEALSASFRSSDGECSGSRGLPAMSVSCSC